MADSRTAVAVQVVDVPRFEDRIDYEGILGRAFSSPTDRDRLASGLVVVLATREGAEELRRLRETTLVVPLRESLASLALRRQIVALRWAP